MVKIVIVVMVGYVIVWIFYIVFLMIGMYNLDFVSDVGVLILVYFGKLLVCYNLFIYIFMYKKF